MKSKKSPSKGTDKPPASEPVASKLAEGLNALAESKGFLPAPPVAPAVANNGDFDPASEARKLNVWRLNQGGGSFFVPSSEEGSNWIVYNGSELKRALKDRGISCARPEDSSMSEAERLIFHVQSKRNVEAQVEALAGYDAGVHVINSRRVLVRSNFTLVEPQEGEFPTIRGLIESNLKPEQGKDLCPYFYAWLKVAFESLREKTFQTGQILYLIGPQGCGKSRLQEEIITPLLGGRSANPLDYLTNKTAFNEELTGAEHLQVEDPDISATFDERNHFGKRLKQFAANEGHTLHPKGSKGFRVNPFWRVSVSQNDDQTSLDMLPPLEVVGDKLILLRCQPPDPERFQMPKSKEERLIFVNNCRDELPAFAWWLLNWEIPEQYASDRYTAASFIDPWVTGELTAHSYETNLLQCIDAELFVDEQPLLDGNWQDVNTWKGNSTELFNLLTRDASNSRKTVNNLCKTSMVLGKLLTALSRQRPERVKVAPRRAESAGYFIYRAKAAAE